MIDQTNSFTSRNLAMIIAAAADDRKAADIILFDVSELCYLADYFVIVTGFSKPQLRAISDSIRDQVVQVTEKQPLRVEGKSGSSWILQDYGDVIAHIFLPEEREFYNLEAFWGHAHRLEFQPQLNPSMRE